MSQLTLDEYDVCVIGGGINGVGIASDLSGRGLKVAVVEARDFASATSSASSKLIHGGIRYLEQYQFALVRESLKEREILLKQAPHLIKELRFIMPHNKRLRPAWLIRLGLFLYDTLGGRKWLQASKGLRFKASPDNPLKPSYTKGFEYSDCQVDDARLVIANAMRAKEKGAALYNYTQVLDSEKDGEFWKLYVEDVLTKQTFSLKAKYVVNAGGPWVNSLLGDCLHAKSKYRTRLVKGSHIVVDKLYEQDKAYILQHTDGRVIFVIPYLDHYTMIGTTDIPYQGSARDVKISQEETTYLCEAVSNYFNTKIEPSQVIESWSGVRPLLDDDSDNPSSVTREYKLEVSSSKNAPLLSIFGGKLTTYRHLSEQAADLVMDFFKDKKPLSQKALKNEHWTQFEILPGGDILEANLDDFILALCKKYTFLPKQVLVRYAKQYGSKTHQLLRTVSNLTDMGHHFGLGCYQREIDYLVEFEWVRTLDDVIWRRTKLGYQFTKASQNELENYLDGKFGRL